MFSLLIFLFLGVQVYGKSFVISYQITRNFNLKDGILSVWGPFDVRMKAIQTFKARLALKSFLIPLVFTSLIKLAKS